MQDQAIAYRPLFEQIFAKFCKDRGAGMGCAEFVTCVGAMKVGLRVTAAGVRVRSSALPSQRPPRRVARPHHPQVDLEDEHVASQFWEVCGFPEDDDGDEVDPEDAPEAAAAIRMDVGAFGSGLVRIANMCVIQLGADSEGAMSGLWM